MPDHSPERSPLIGQKVLLVASFPDSVIRFRGELIAALLAKGLSVHVAVPKGRGTGRLREVLAARNGVLHEITLQRASTNPVMDLLALAQLWRLMRSIRPEFVLSYTIKPVIYGSIAAWLARVPRRYALVTGLGYAFTAGRNGALPGLVSKLYSIALAKTHKVFFQNPDDQRLFRERAILGAGTPSVVVNGSGVDIAEFQLQPPPGGNPTFLMIARLLGDKGVREYALAAQQVRQSFPDVRFSLVGWIDENPDAISQDELDAWTRDGDIEFLGRLEDVRPAISKSSVYVLPSYREGTPRTVLEAMAMGRAIITTDAPGCRETVIDGQNGFLVRTQSVDELVNAMRKFIDNPELAGAMGKRSREIAEEKYDVHKVNAVMLREMGIE